MIPRHQGRRHLFSCLRMTHIFFPIIWSGKKCASSFSPFYCGSVQNVKVLEFWEHTQCARYADLRYIPYLYCFSMHFVSIPFHFVVYSIYTKDCIVVTYLFAPSATLTVRGNQNSYFSYLTLIMGKIYTYWLDFNTNRYLSSRGGSVSYTPPLRRSLVSFSCRHRNPFPWPLISPELKTQHLMSLAVTHWQVTCWFRST